MDSNIITAWLIEYIGSSPCPVYATGGPFYSCDPWSAIWFDTEEEAKIWMTRPGILGFRTPWRAVCHSFSFSEPDIGKTGQMEQTIKIKKAQIRKLEILLDVSQKETKGWQQECYRARAARDRIAKHLRRLEARLAALDEGVGRG